MSGRAAPGPAAMRRIVELACRAPSVHNTQPWLWRLDGARIDLYGDDRRRLRVADTDGRNLTISCGAALDHARVAAGSLGLETRVRRTPTPGNLDHLASIDLAPGRRSAQALVDLDALQRRRTDRSRFTAWPMSGARLDSLARSVSVPGVRITPVTDVSERFRLELLVSRAMSRQDSDPRYLEEQRRWIEHSRVDGIPIEALRTGSRPVGRPSRFARTPPVEMDDLVRSSDGLLLISTDDDDRAAWLRAGEALSQAWLRATTEGLSVVPLSQVVEVGETRAVLHHDFLAAKAAPQSLLRIGWQEIGRGGRAPTPRRPLDEVLIR